jgi:predicted O-methyltransferase YrrM
MRVGYTLRASTVMVLHPAQGVERVRGRLDRHGDRRALAATGLSASALYGPVEDWAERLHVALEVPFPCPAAESFGPVWDRVVADLAEAGARVGIASYGGWNDGDRAFAQAIWCLIAHLRPETVVETGVAHGLTSRVILEGLSRNGNGHLWSVDLPAVDSALHPEIGMAVREGLRPRWTYVPGTARERLPSLLRELGEIDLFVHDSLHTGRNQAFELQAAWAALRAGGAAVVDDIDHSLAFRTFVAEASPRASLTARHVTGPGLMGPDGLWGLAVKGTEAPAPTPRRDHLSMRQRQAAHSAAMAGIAASPHYRAAAAQMDDSTARERQHAQIELSAIREIAFLVQGLAPPGSRLLQIQPRPGPEILLFRDQIVRPARPVSYDQADGRAPAVKAETDFEQVDLEAARLPAPDGHFDLVVWNRELVALKNATAVLREVRRVIRPGGFLVLAVPNLAAAHNRLLLLAGRQPTTLHINSGDHVRGFAASSMTRVLERDLLFRVEQSVGVGIAPVTGMLLPRPVRDLGHTVIWVLRKPDGCELSLTRSPPLASTYRSPVCGQRQVWSPDSISRTPARPTHPTCRAGMPTASPKSGTSRVTTAPAPIMAQRPITQPARITARAPTDAPSRTTTPRAIQSAGRLSFPATSTDRGN